jgi:uncharacterized circularly permuted ATP-grasp superfamily protein
MVARRPSSAAHGNPARTRPLRYWKVVATEAIPRSSVLPYDEVLEASGHPREAYRALWDRIGSMSLSELHRRRALAESAFRTEAITFSVLGERGGSERLLPFDIVPRILLPDEWRRIELGLVQRVTALNLFLADVYGNQRILTANVVPPEVVLSSPQFRRELVGFPVPKGIHCHLAGIDLVRRPDGAFAVLEDNLRTPSGVSYMLNNRRVLRRVLPELFEDYEVRPVEGFADVLLAGLRAIAPPRSGDNPTVALLTPGTLNSAYFEHLFLAKQMGVELVEGSDLAVRDEFVYMRTTEGLTRVDVIYRRIDDDFVDPVFGRLDSLVGVPGLVNAYRRGNVAIANALGNGVADDKAVCGLVPEMIRYYLGEAPLLDSVTTYLCLRDHDRSFVLDHLDELVVKTVDGSGGHGMLIGPMASAGRREEFRRRILAQPRNYVAQPLVELSVQATLMRGGLANRKQDLRPFVVMGDAVHVCPGGLTRVALRAGSTVVNSSQGGGSRDTWVLATEPGA